MSIQPFMHSKEDLAHRAIAHFVATGEILALPAEEAPADLRPEATCFVSVYVDHHLRGCIGSYQPREALYRDIIHHAILAAAFDARFYPIQPEELPYLTVEVSVLSPVQPLAVTGPDRLLAFLSETRPGLILRKGSRRALFLPQVWETCPAPEQFLSLLCQKAGLPQDAWQDGDVEYSIFSIQTDR